jgi:hypothetical protein
MSTALRACCALAVLAIAVQATAFPPPEPESPYQTAWMKQLGTSEPDWATGVAGDGQGNVYLAGMTLGSLAGPNIGGEDAFLYKYDGQGSLLWQRQFGTAAHDSASCACADPAGNAIVAGTTFGALGGPNAGYIDAFVAKYSPSGEQLWARQVGTLQEDGVGSVSTDRQGNIYFCGSTSGSLGGPSAGLKDVFFGKYDPAGNLLWMKQMGTDRYDTAGRIRADDHGNVYVLGNTQGSIGAPNSGQNDLFLCKLDPSGDLVWVRQVGTQTNDTNGGLALDGRGNIYFTGQTSAALGGTYWGSQDFCLFKYDENGGLVWSRQFGTSLSDGIMSIAVDYSGDLFLGGYTWGSFGEPVAGRMDILLARVDADGTLEWTRQFGSSENDYPQAICGDIGEIYLCGITVGSLAAPNQGGDDAFLIKFVPEPAMLFGLALGAAAILRRRRLTPSDRM